jgi:BirA family transcriptional regulator, biotin operon repressor / biotin---[acetyl-CoA-carboxylase] ligase
VARLPSGAYLDIFETLDSTSLEARRRAPLGEPGPRWFIALRQTAGYGRQGRAWRQATGDFAGTLAFKPQAAASALGQISFIAALAVASALDEIVEPRKLALKWPNDILIDGAKAAGILLEHIDGADISKDGAALLAVGIGVNIVSAPSDVAYKTARLVDHADQPPSPGDLAARIDHHFWAYMKDWRANGFSNIRQLWLTRAKGIGEAITVRLPNEELSGVFEGIDESGALILQSGAEKRIISAGDVFF